MGPSGSSIPLSSLLTFDYATKHSLEQWWTPRSAGVDLGWVSRQVSVPPSSSLSPLPASFSSSCFLLLPASFSSVLSLPSHSGLFSSPFLPSLPPSLYSLPISFSFFLSFPFLLPFPCTGSLCRAQLGFKLIILLLPTPKY